MARYPVAGPLGRTLLGGFFASLFACTPSPDAGWTLLQADDQATGTALSTTLDARPAALLNGRMIEWSELRPMLNEAAGAEVLQEVVLDRMIDDELTQAGVIITSNDLDREQHLFYTTLDADHNVSARIARELRDRRGLGRHRFRALLRRNAGLRALVADDVLVSDEAVRRSWEIVYGPRRQARIMVLLNLAAAEAALARLADGELFGDLTVELSTDASASRGGLLEPISRADAAYPQAVRESLWSLTVGEISSPVLLDTGYALITLVRVIEADEIDLEQVRPDLERLVRLDQERLLMDRLARRLLRQATVTIIDDTLRERWEARLRRTR